MLRSAPAAMASVRAHRGRCRRSGWWVRRGWWTLLLPALLLLASSLSSCSSSDSGGGSDPGDIFNRAPEVEEISWDNPYQLYVPGDVVVLSVTAHDADGDTLSYSWDWATAPGGSYDDSTAATVTVTIGDQVGLFQAQVTVSDGSNPVTRRVGFTVAHSLGGTLFSDTVWGFSGSPYVITSDVVVPHGIRLTIEAGVQLQLRRHGEMGGLLTGIRVEGELSAVGTTAQPVSFSANGNRDLDGIGQRGISVDDEGTVELRFFRMKAAECGVHKEGRGSCQIEDGVFRGCQVGYQGMRDVNSGWMSAATLQRVEFFDSVSHGIDLNQSTAELEEVAVRFSGGAGIRIAGTMAGDPASAQVSRCELDSNEDGNLRLEGNSWVEMHCSNLIPADGGGKNVVLQVNALTPGGTLPMTDCFWGLSNPVSEEAIRDATFEGRVDADTWLRETDLSGFRSTAIDFNQPSDPCNS